MVVVSLLLIMTTSMEIASRLVGSSRLGGTCTPAILVLHPHPNLDVVMRGQLMLHAAVDGMARSSTTLC